MRFPPYLQIPDVTLSQDALDFGTVQTGHTMVTTLQLHNYRQVRGLGSSGMC